jgi:hypothetical protein
MMTLPDPGESAVLRLSQGRNRMASDLPSLKKPQRDHTLRLLSYKPFSD